MRKLCGPAAASTSTTGIVHSHPSYIFSEKHHICTTQRPFHNPSNVRACSTYSREPGCVGSRSAVNPNHSQDQNSGTANPDAYTDCLDPRTARLLIRNVQSADDGSSSLMTAQQPTDTHSSRALPRRSCSPSPTADAADHPYVERALCLERKVQRRLQRLVRM
jgi:hypothetical protein